MKMREQVSTQRITMIRMSSVLLLLAFCGTMISASAEADAEGGGADSLWPRVARSAPKTPAPKNPAPAPAPAQHGAADKSSHSPQRMHSPSESPGHSHDRNSVEPFLTCQAHCPRCPSCPAPTPAPTCPSPCAACPAPQQCPTPCAACPACPACKGRIPPGYEHFDRLGYYRLHLTPITWAEAKSTCETEGAHLAIINSQAEADLMKKLFHRDLDIGKWIWLGFHDLYKEGTYVTLLGSPLAASGYTTWNPNQPDNAGNNENCGSMFPSGGLNDLTCTLKQPFVCEYPV